MNQETGMTKTVNGGLTGRLPTRALEIAVLIVLTCVFAGCVITSQSRRAYQGQPRSSSKLIKPYIPQDSGTSSSGNSIPPGQPTPMAPPGTLPRSGQPEAVPDLNSAKGLIKPRQQEKLSPGHTKKPLWEDQKVKRAAMQKLKEYPAVKKIKICYAVKDDEWWVILYDDVRTHYELRQFTWDREHGRLQPFLVLKRIAKDQLNEHLSASEPDRACEVLDVGRHGSRN